MQRGLEILNLIHLYLLAAMATQLPLGLMGMTIMETVYAGQVRIYAWNRVEWLQKGQDIVGEAAGDGSGYSMCLSGDGTAVNDANGIYSEHVRVFIGRPFFQ